MATPVRRQLGTLIRDLEDDAARFEFFQAVRLLEAATPDRTAVCARPKAAVHLRAAPDVSFPAADLRRAYHNQAGEMVLEANFLGLYGVDAPLPAYFWETVARNDDQGRCLRAFLDLFGSRIYELLYLAWKKTRAHLLDEGDSLLEAYLLALSGTAPGTRRDLALAFAGGLGSRNKGGAVLAGMLEELLDVPVRVEEFVPCWVAVGQVAALGRYGMTLGDDVVLGERVLDVSRKINILLGPLEEKRALELFPGNRGAAELHDLIKSYLEPTLEFGVIFHVVASTAPRALGRDALHLGWTSGLGKAGADVRRIRLAGCAYLN